MAYIYQLTINDMDNNGIISLNKISNVNYYKIGTSLDEKDYMKYKDFSFALYSNGNPIQGDNIIQIGKTFIYETDEIVKIENLQIKPIPIQGLEPSIPKSFRIDVIAF